MAKQAVMTADENSLGNRMKGWPQRTKSFYNDVRSEMKKVSVPSRKEVQSTTVVVVITVFIFGLYFWVVDNAIGKLIDYVFTYFKHH
ncbi:MAG TPA: preprotein translocase subunit SecE [Candidatus Koribacter sp.]|jgi:preprotein translocase subunit SecE